MAKAVMGPGITSAGLGGYGPQVNRGGFASLRERKLFHSQREVALLLEKTLRGGYGDILAGTVLAEMTAAPYDLVPYTPDTISTSDISRVFLVNDNITATTFKIWAEDRGKLKAADVIVLTDSDGTFEEATISSMAEDTGGRTWTVTLSGATATVGGFTVAKSANCYLKAGASGKRSTAKYILDQDVYTGNYENPGVGSPTSVFVSNGVLYNSMMIGLDSTAASALGAVIDGKFVVVK